MMCNWDNIELDDTANHNSRIYFAQRRSKHERFDGIKAKETEEDFDKSVDELALSFDSAKVTETKADTNEDVYNNCENKENISVSGINQMMRQKPKLNLVTPSRFENAANANCMKPKSGPSERLIAIPKKREQLLQEQIAKESKMREFHSRPMPTFKVPQNIKNKKHKATVPKTPVVAKRSRESQLKRVEKSKEIEENLKPAPFKAHAANILKEAPFIPKKAPTVLVTKPYNLRSEQRLAERKKYDEAMQRALSEKEKQQKLMEEEQRRLEEERYKETRKATNFKARPNPFK